MNISRHLRNPVLLNELKVRMRSNRSAWMLMIYLLILGGIALLFMYMLLGWGSRFDPDNVRIIFMFLSVLQLGLVCFFTPGLTAGVISGDRERQTLSVLLTTNITPTKLILGKWLSSLAFMIFLVLSSMPLYGIVFLYGGIAPLQILQVFAFYLITMLGLGSIGVLFSTVFRRTGIATVATYAVLFIYTAGTAFFSFVLNRFIEHQQQVAHYTPSKLVEALPDLLMGLNPIVAILDIFQVMRFFTGNSTLPIRAYWLYFLVFALITVLALAYAIHLIKPVRTPIFKKAGKAASSE